MISVIIPVYNREKTVNAAIRSVLNQTIDDIEVIVVDDGSTDESAKIIKSICDNRIKYVYQKNSGACVARNYGINVAQGEYIAFHDSDDIWHSDKLEKQIKVLNDYKVDLVFCKLNQIQKDGTVIKLPQNINGGIIKPVTTVMGIGTQTIIGKSKVFREFNFDKDFPRFQEMELLYRISQRYTMYCLDEGLVDYYIGEDSISKNYGKLYAASQLLMKKHPEIVKDYPVMRKELADNLLIAGYNMKREKKRGYDSYYKLALKFDSSFKTRLKKMLLDTGIYKMYLRNKHIDIA